MIEVQINGQTRDTSKISAKSLGDLMDLVQSEVQENEQLVTEWKVDGHMVDPTDKVRGLAIEHIGSLEIKSELKTTVLDRSFLSLESFVDLTLGLIEEIDEGSEIEFQENIIRLMDGIQTITDSVFAIRSFLKVGYNPRLKVLEEDLLSILRDIFEFQQKGHRSYVIELLQVHLKKNLEEWKTSGLPELKSKPLK